MKIWLNQARKSTADVSGVLLPCFLRGPQHPRRFLQLSVYFCYTAREAATFAQALVRTVACATAGKQ
jgi:hypothetical protein